MSEIIGRKPITLEDLKALMRGETVVIQTGEYGAHDWEALEIFLTGVAKEYVVLTKERIDGANEEREAAIAKGNRMCCHLEFDVLVCTFRAEVTIYSLSGDTDTCSLHLFEMLEPGENRVYAIA